MDLASKIAVGLLHRINAIKFVEMSLGKLKNKNDDVGVKLPDTCKFPKQNITIIMRHSL